MFRLAAVLSHREVKRVLSQVHDLKHQAMLQIIYGCGLRRSKLIHLKISDIDSDRRVVVIRQAKGGAQRGRNDWFHISQGDIALKGSMGSI